MSRQQYGLGYWRGVEDATTNNVKPKPNTLYSVIYRLRKKREAGKLPHCVCEFADAMIVHEGNIWEEDGMLFFLPNDPYSIQYDGKEYCDDFDVCPICNRKFIGFNAKYSDYKTY